MVMVSQLLFAGKDPDGRKIVFPFHDEVDKYTLKGALIDAEVDIEEFLKNL